MMINAVEKGKVFINEGEGTLYIYLVTPKRQCGISGEGT